MISISLPEKKAHEILMTELNAFRVIESNGEFVLCILTGFELKDDKYQANVTQIDFKKDDDAMEYFIPDNKDDDMIRFKESKGIIEKNYHFNSERFKDKFDKDSIKEMNHVLKHLLELQTNAAITIDRSFETGIVTN